VEEIAEIWTLTQAFFDQRFELWQAVRAYDQLSDKFLEHYKKTLARLKAVSEEHRAFFDCSQ
jgi:hypothetical protein